MNLHYFISLLSILQVNKCSLLSRYKNNHLHDVQATPYYNFPRGYENPNVFNFRKTVSTRRRPYLVFENGEPPETYVWYDTGSVPTEDLAYIWDVWPTFSQWSYRLTTTPPMLTTEAMKSKRTWPSYFPPMKSRKQDPNSLIIRPTIPLQIQYFTTAEGEEAFGIFATGNIDGRRIMDEQKGDHATIKKNGGMLKNLRVTIGNKMPPLLKTTPVPMMKPTPTTTTNFTSESSFPPSSTSTPFYVLMNQSSVSISMLSPFGDIYGEFASIFRGEGSSGDSDKRGDDEKNAKDGNDGDKNGSVRNDKDNVNKVNGDIGNQDDDKGINDHGKDWNGAQTSGYSDGKRSEDSAYIGDKDVDIGRGNKGSGKEGDGNRRSGEKEGGNEDSGDGGNDKGSADERSGDGGNAKGSDNDGSDDSTTSKTSKCYKCGLNSTGIPRMPGCYHVFDAEDKRKQKFRQNYKTRCKYDTNSRFENKTFFGPNYIGGCFKRFLDIGVEYIERGCRTWPPTKGRSFASNRYRRLEILLKGAEDGCVHSPQASLTPFARSISLYVRYHVCVCTGRYCNGSQHSLPTYNLTLISMIYVSVNNVLK